MLCVLLYSGMTHYSCMTDAVMLLCCILYLDVLYRPSMWRPRPA